MDETLDGVLPVLIVGAGPTGLTLACELARRGIRCRLIESAPGPQPGSRGKGLQPRSLEVFAEIGIVERVIATGRLAMPIRATAADGTVSMSGDEPTQDRPDIPYAAGLITPEWRIEAALRGLLGTLNGLVEFGTTFERLEQSPGSVTAFVTAGGSVHRLEARWVVGCDGGHSAVRKQVGIAFDGETREAVRMIVADVAADGIGREAWHMWRHEDGLVSLCPLPSTELFQFQAGIAPGQDASLTLANMQAILERRARRENIRLHEPQWSSLWRANVRLVERYREGRVLLAGDAAHIHSPAGGQGMNTGIQDAYNLGWKLAAVTQGASPALLDTYGAERRPIAADVLALSNARLQQVIEQKGLPVKRDPATSQLGVNYRGSALARDDRDDTAALRAGDRAPDATGLVTLHGECRLFDLTRGGRFTLLNFGAAGSPASGRWPLGVLRIVGRPEMPGELADPTGQLARAYGAGSRTLVLIRPDGYVALISDRGDIAAVSNYLATIG